MVNLTRLLFPEIEGGDLRGRGHGRNAQPGAGRKDGPVVTWDALGRLSASEAAGLVDDLAAMGVPVLIMTARGPELDPGLVALAAHALQRGIGVTLNSGGAFVSAVMARQLAAGGMTYISLPVTGDLTPRTADSLRNCRAEGLRVSLGFGLRRESLPELPQLCALVESEGAQRLAVYHQVYGSREEAQTALTAEEIRGALDYLLSRALQYRIQERDFELVTLDNHVDPVYAYLKTKEWDADRAARMWRVLSRSMGNQSGVGLAYVDEEGDVHPDPHTRNHTFGNVRSQRFSEIWAQARHPVQLGLRSRQLLLTGRCSACRWLPICNGNSRTRAEADCGDLWASDPQCYLTDREIALP